MNKTIATLLLAFLLVACGQHKHGHVVHSAESHDVDPAIYASAVANPARSDADRARDAGRKPAEVLKFFGITPGMKVFDMFSGGGYYAEILTHVVGDTGLVIAHTNETSLGYVGDEFNARYGDDRLPIVEILMAENNELELEKRSNSTPSSWCSAITISIGWRRSKAGRKSTLLSCSLSFMAA
ncbi:MAG: hypothetical protein IIA11_00870 [Proteobacteria bacterium]|nr:hypothetical protein [Pseudomonadota bacterium]